MLSSIQSSGRSKKQDNATVKQGAWLVESPDGKPPLNTLAQNAQRYPHDTVLLYPHDTSSISPLYVSLYFI